MPLDYVISLTNTGLLVLAVSFGVWAMMKFLQRGEGSSNNLENEKLKKELLNIRNKFVHMDSSELSEKIETIRDELNSIKSSNSPMPESKREEFVESLRSKIEAEASGKILDEIKDNIEKEYTEKNGSSGKLVGKTIAKLS